MSDNISLTAAKTRFCPSPTGYIHLGNVRTALFSALLAKHMDGTFLLRIEDTDRERSDDVYTQALMQDLRWLGLLWQEGVEAGGDYGPYHQSNRQPIYDDYYHRLIAMKIAYPCFCSEQQLALHRKLQRQSGKPPRYPGTCSRLTAQEIAEKEAAGLRPTLRFRVPENKEVSFVDLVRGEQRFNSDDIGDFIIRRADGTSPFMYGNAIDDAMMGVTHVLRGEDHLTNTPRQIMILEALGLRIPNYGHIALIVGPDGCPLSKRHGSRSVKALREEGFLPGALVNYLARLGHYYGHDDYESFAELASAFNCDALAKSPAKYNEKQLLFWQAQAVSELGDAAFWDWVGPAIQALVPDVKQDKFVAMIKPNVRFPEDVNRWAIALFSPLETWDDGLHAVIHEAGRDYFTESLAAIEKYGVDSKKITAHLKSALGLSGKKLFMPLRVALTLHAHGPDLAEVLSLMTDEEIIRRLKKGEDDTYRD